MTAHRGNRYGRSDAARESVLRAADDLLVEVGFAAMTVEGLARRAGVAKQTIYRSWPKITDVLLDVVRRDTGKRLQFPDTGKLHADLTAMIETLAAFLVDDDAGRVLLALRAHAELDAGFRESFERAFGAEQRDRELAPLLRALERGELPAGTDPAAVRQLVVGPVYSAAAEGRLDGAVVDGVLAAAAALWPPTGDSSPRPSAPRRAGGRSGRARAPRRAG